MDTIVYGLDVSLGVRKLAVEVIKLRSITGP